MKRKLIKQGIEGLTVYLPKKWADQRGLKPSDEVEIDPVGDTLLISSAVKKPKEITMELAKITAEPIARMFIECYCAGYDKITIRAKPKTLAELEAKLSSLVFGFEVIEKRQDALVLENIGEPSEEKFEIVFRRIFLLIKDMGNMIAQQSKIGFDKVLQVDKLVFFCQRSISKKILSFPTPTAHWELLSQLSAIAHGYWFMSEAAKKMGKNESDYLSAVNDYFGELYRAYWEKDLVLVSSLFQQRTKLIFIIPDNLIEKGENSLLVSKIQYVMRLMRGSLSAIFNTLVDEFTMK